MDHQDMAARQWRKSGRCDANDCVEVAQGMQSIAVRDSTQPRVQLEFDAASWRDLLSDLRAGAVGR